MSGRLPTSTEFRKAPVAAVKKLTRPVRWALVAVC
jgi:hypothetical protein